MFLPDPNRPRARKIFLWISAGLVAASLGLGARPIYRSLKLWQAERIMAQAEQLSSRQKWPEALEKAQAALHLNPKNGRAVPLMARTLTRLHSPDAFTFWNTLLSWPSATESDFQEAIRLALELGRWDSAELYLAEGLRRMPFSNELLRSAVGFCDLKGDSARTIQLARTLLARQPASVEIRLVLARRLLALRQPAEAQEASALLWQVARSNLPGSDAALRFLAGLPELTKSEAEECLVKLRSTPGRGADHDLLAADIQLRLLPQKRSELIAGVIAKYGKGAPADQLSLAHWLSQKREFKKVIETIPAASTLASKELFLVFLDAEAALGHWAEIERRLAQPQLPIEPVLVALYQARVAGQLKKERQAELHWAQAQWLASQRPETLWYVAQYAEKVGAMGQAEKAYRRLSQLPPSAAQAYLALVRLAEQKADTRALRDLMKELIVAFPNDPAPRNDLAYLELLTQENITSAVEAAKTLFAGRPGTLAYRTTLALAYLRTNHPKSAQALYDNLEIDWKTAPPGWRAVYAAVLAANGDTKSARQLANQLPRQQLKVEESALMEPWL